MICNRISFFKKIIKIFIYGFLIISYTKKMFLILIVYYDDVLILYDVNDDVVRLMMMY